MKPLQARAARPRPASQTPLMAQYRRLKAEHPGALLFFRLGDFYEMFFEDAVLGASLLGLTLTSRNKNDPDPIPMCGIPWHQRDAYVARLLRLGHKVAICEQLEDPASAKGLVQRGVTEVLTPGSVMGEGFLEPSVNNYLAALWPEAETVGICLADASTGEVYVGEASWPGARDLLDRWRIAEWLIPELPEQDPVSARLAELIAGSAAARSSLAPERFLDHVPLEKRWDLERLSVFEGRPRAASAAAATLFYLDRVQGGPALTAARVRRWDAHETLNVDGATARHLELFRPQPGSEPEHTLWHHLNLTVTASGSRRLRSWIERPLADLPPLLERQREVDRWAQAGAARARFRETLRGLPDLERLAARIACGRATPRDLGAVRDALERLPALARQLAENLDLEVGESLAGAPALAEQLARALVDDPPPLSREGGIVRRGFDEVRDGLDDLAHSGKRWIADLEASERARSGIPSLKVGFNRVFGYYLEVTRSHRDRVPADYERRQTLTTAERFVTPGLKAKESEVLGAEDKLRAREHELFVELREQAAPHVPALQRAADTLARLDSEAALAEAAARYGWVRPELERSERLLLDEARHPVVERLLPHGEFVPNPVALDREGPQILLLTGPNMGGKSTYLRQIALCVILAQSGSHVPAARAVVGIVDRLFTRVGAADRLGAGQSTFMVEMVETADILRNATPRSLVLLDEVGRGTATYDGLALAWAVTEALHDRSGPRPRTLFATHYHELTQLSETLPRLRNLHVTARERGREVVFLHRVAEGAADRSYGIHVARLAGIPEGVLGRAEEVLHELESERTVEHLEARASGQGRRRAEPPATLPLFQAELHPLIGELAGIDPEGITPLEALQRIAEWKKKWS